MMLAILIAQLTLGASQPPSPPSPVPTPGRALTIARQRLRHLPIPRQQNLHPNAPMARIQVIKVSRAVPVQPHFNAKWNPVAGVQGYVLRYGLATNTFYWSKDAGTNTQVTVNTAGGFTYFVTVQSYWSIPAANHRFTRIYSPMASNVTAMPVLPLNSPQLLVYGNQWAIQAQSDTNLNLMASPDMRTWQKVGSISSGVKAAFSGLTTTSQFYKLSP